MSDSTKTVLDSMAEQINSLGQEAKRLVDRMDGRADDESYKGYKIIPGANNTFAVFERGVAIKTKLKSIEDAKKWIDSK